METEIQTAVLRHQKKTRISPTENVTLVRVRPEDGAQFYRWGPDDITQTMWITGWARASNVEPGDKGRLEYRTGKAWGLWFFVRENKEQ